MQGGAQKGFDMHSLPETASRRNIVERENDHHRDHRSLANLTAGGREIWRRTHRSASTCNLIAAIAGIGQREVM